MHIDSGDTAKLDDLVKLMTTTPADFHDEPTADFDIMIEHMSEHLKSEMQQTRLGRWGSRYWNFKHIVYPLYLIAYKYIRPLHFNQRKVFEGLVSDHRALNAVEGQMNELIIYVQPSGDVVIQHRLTHEIKGRGKGIRAALQDYMQRQVVPEQITSLCVGGEAG